MGIAMTVGIAVIYPDGVVLGSDSQATHSDINYKSKAIKVARLGKRTGMVASGSLDFYQELVRELTAYGDMDEPFISDVAIDVAAVTAKTYVQLAVRMGKRAITQEEVLPLVRELAGLAPISVLLGGVDSDGTPRVYEMKPPFSLYAESRFGVIGSGKPYAAMSLKPRYRGTARRDEAAQWVVRAVRDTSEVDPYVGGEIQLATIDAASSGEWFSKANEEDLARYLNGVHAEDAAVKVATGSLTEHDFASRRLQSSARRLRSTATEFEKRFLDELRKRQTPL